MAPNSDNGMQHVSSPYSVPETLKRIESLFQEKGLTIFCRIDHSGEAEKVGLKMHATQLLLFGSPKAGTPVMIASPTIAIDLPLKDAAGKVWVSHNSPEYLQQRHQVPGDLAKNISAAGPLLQLAVK
jgi:uncharacterized protein (DUF302 family)